MNHASTRQYLEERTGTALQEDDEDQFYMYKLAATPDEAEKTAIATL